MVRMMRMGWDGDEDGDGDGDDGLSPSVIKATGQSLNKAVIRSLGSGPTRPIQILPLSCSGLTLSLLLRLSMPFQW